MSYRHSFSCILSSHLFNTSSQQSLSSYPRNTFVYTSSHTGSTPYSTHLLSILSHPPPPTLTPTPLQDTFKKHLFRQPSLTEPPQYPEPYRKVDRTHKHTYAPSLSYSRTPPNTHPLTSPDALVTHNKIINSVTTLATHPTPYAFLSYLPNTQAYMRTHTLSESDLPHILSTPSHNTPSLHTPPCLGLHAYSHAQ